MSQQLNITGQFVNTSTGNTLSLNINLAIVSPLAVTTAVALSSGTNTITIPTGTTLIIIQFPAANVATVTQKGIAGDTGILMLKTGLSMFTPDPADTSFVITAGGAIALLTYITFI